MKHLVRIWQSSTLVLSISLTQTGCGGGAETGNDVLSATNSAFDSIAELAGVYRGAIARKACVGDENYFVIGSGGAVTFYDYQGDGCGTGDNCYTKPTAPQYTPALLREASGNLEARFAPLFTFVDYQRIEFEDAETFTGTSFRYFDALTGGPAVDTEQAFGTKVSSPSAVDLETQLCP